jgi:hypothetical protein
VIADVREQGEDRVIELIGYRYKRTGYQRIPLDDSDFSGHDFLPFRWLVFTNSVSRTASRPTGCLIKYGVIQFDEC